MIQGGELLNKIVTGLLYEGFSGRVRYDVGARPYYIVATINQ
jgi:hypothetical protein